MLIVIVVFQRSEWVTYFLFRNALLNYPFIVSHHVLDQQTDRWQLSPIGLERTLRYLSVVRMKLNEDHLPSLHENKADKKTSMAPSSVPHT